MRALDGENNLHREYWAVLCLLMLLAFCTFANTFGSTWTYDDFPVIVENPDIRSWQNFIVTTYPGRPL